MKKIAVLGLVIIGTAAWASHPVRSENASPNACFGQWRSVTADGEVFAFRKGFNAMQNQLDMAACAH